MFEHTKTRVALLLVILVGVIAITVGTVVSANAPTPTSKPTCAYTSGCQYSTVGK